MAYSKLIHFDWIVNIFLWSATQSLTVLCLSGFNKPVLKFATSWFEGDKKKSLIEMLFSSLCHFVMYLGLCNLDTEPTFNKPMT